MPVITLQGPTIGSSDLKRTMVKEVTAAAAKAYDMPEDKIILIFQDTKPDDVAVGGQLIADR